MAHTHTPRQNKDDSTFEQGSNKTVIAIKNKNAIPGCHGNQHSRTPGNVVKHATEHKAAKQVKRLFIRLQHVVQCPLVRAQGTRTGPNLPKAQVPVPRAPAARSLEGSRGDAGHAPSALTAPGGPGHRSAQTESQTVSPRALGNVSAAGPAEGRGLARMKAAVGMAEVSKHNPRSWYVFLRTKSPTVPCPEI